jgi:hypothetical protein
LICAVQCTGAESSRFFVFGRPAWRGMVPSLWIKLGF